MATNNAASNAATIRRPTSNFLKICAWLLLAFASENCRAAAPLETYGSLPQLEDSAISPSGEKIAVVTKVKGTRSLVVLDADRHPLLVYGLTDYKLDQITWGGDGIVLVNLRATANLGVSFTAEKAEIFSTIVVPLNGNKPWMVFEKDHEIVGGVRGFYGTAQRDGHSYGYFGGITMTLGDGAQYYIDEMRPDLYEVDLETAKTRRIDLHPPGESAERTWLVDTAGTVSARLDQTRNSGSWKISNGKWDELGSGKQPLGDVDLLALGPDGTSLVYIVHDGKGGGDSMIQVPLAGGAPKAVLADEEIRRFFIDRRRRLIGYQPAGPWKSEFFGTRPQQVMAGVENALAGKSLRLVDVDAGWQKLIVESNGPGDPGTWWLVDAKKGSMDALGTSYAIPAEDIGPVETVKYTATDGLEMEGILTLPPHRAATGLPVLILPHGGPAARDYAEFDWMAQAFASRGYAVFQPNFRGSTGYGAAFERAGHGQWGQAMQTDISDGLAQLVHRGTVDPSRACIMGASFGGYAALAGVTLQQGLYRCAIAVAGISDLFAMYHLDVTRSGDDRALIRNFKNEIGSLPDLGKLSPIAFVDRITVPVLLIHGKDDTVVDYTQSKKMFAAMQAANKPVELVTLEGEDHWLSKAKARNAMLKAAMDFVLLHNPPDK